MRFVDIDNSHTLRRLSRDEDLRRRLSALGVEDLDRGALSSADRQVTRLLAHYIYSVTDDARVGLNAGLRYHSRLGKEHVCWAIFEHRARFHVRDQRAIERTDADLLKVARTWSLTIH